jgi:2,5-dichloro-2,5-cyclohexadiene-1,4-diol dehydrogenase 1
MTKTLEGKSIILTGAAGGIGEASARIFVREGANVLLADVNDVLGTQLEAELIAAGGNAKFVKTNVADEDSVRAMVDAAIAAFGKIDGAFNNAGIGYPGDPLHLLSKADFQRVLDVNLTGVFLSMKHEIAAMLTSGGGSIVNAGSVASVIGLPNSAEYNAAKHGVLGLTRNAAVDYSAKGIRVNALLIGATVTPMLKKQIPDAETNQAIAEQLSLLHRLARSEEIGEAAAWLLSDRSSFVAGTGLNIDGGYTAA